MNILSTIAVYASMAFVSLICAAQGKPAPKPQASPRTQTSSSPIKGVDFLNFDYVFHNCPQSGKTKSIHLANGTYTANSGSDAETVYAIPHSPESIHYGPILGPADEQAIVTVTCKTKSSPLASSEFFVFSTQGNRPTLVGSITEEMIFKDARQNYPEFILFNVANIETLMGRIAIGYSAGKDLCCHENGVSVNYRWNNGAFVSDGTALGGKASLSQLTISGKILRTIQDSNQNEVEIQSGTGRVLVSRLNFMGPPEWASYEKTLWEKVLRESVRGQAITGVDCSPAVHSPNQPSPPEGDAEVACYRIELMPIHEN